MKLLEIFLLFCDNSDALRLLSSENNRDLPNHYCEDHAPCFNTPDGFLNGTTSLSELIISGLSLLFKVGINPNFKQKILLTVG